MIKAVITSNLGNDNQSDAMIFSRIRGLKGFAMVRIKLLNLRMVAIASISIMATWMLSHIGINNLLDPTGILEFQTAAANAQYGIQGQQAPELKLTTWIDGNGLSIDPIELNDYRDKVIYLYFFQDW